MTKLFLDKQGLAQVAGYVNNKLTKVTAMPSNPKDKQAVLYIGETTGALIKGHIYQYQTSTWADITQTPNASEIAYDSTESGLSASNVQSAIDEVNEKVDTLPAPVVPKGTIAFASLPSLTSVEVGWMYNISDDFTTTSDFVIPGISEQAGSNVYCIDTGSGGKKWDVFAAGGDTIVVDQTYDPTSTNAQSGTAVAEAIASVPTGGSTSLRVSLKPKLPKIWSPKTWSGLTNFESNYIWTDGINIYYSKSSNQYVLDPTTSTWSPKTWSGLTEFYGSYIWTDGANIYYSADDAQYVLDTTTSTWSPKTWSGLTNFESNYIWTDGTNIYYSYEEAHYVLDPTTSTWSPKTWSGLTEFYGSYIWTDGANIYYSSRVEQYVLDPTNSTWSPKTWSGRTSFDGYKIWTDGINIYCSSGPTQYVLDPTTSTWSPKTWSGLTNFLGSYIWTDGTNIYYSADNAQYVLGSIGSIRT